MLHTIFEIIVGLAIVSNTCIQLKWYREDRNNRVSKLDGDKVNLLSQISNQLLDLINYSEKTSFNTLNTSKNTYFYNKNAEGKEKNLKKEGLTGVKTNSEKY